MYKTHKINLFYYLTAVNNKDASSENAASFRKNNTFFCEMYVIYAFYSISLALAQVK